MLHYSNASSREKEYAISGDQGGACLEALLQVAERLQRSRTQWHQRRSRGLLEKKRGEEIVNTEQTKHHKT